MMAIEISSAEFISISNGGLDFKFFQNNGFQKFKLAEFFENLKITAF
jgi:hypothetical protein